MGVEWTPEEDRKPGFPFLRQQPEQTELGSVWTQIVSFQMDDLPLSYTQMRLRFIGGVAVHELHEIQAPLTNAVIRQLKVRWLKTKLASPWTSQNDAVTLFTHGK